MLTRLVAFLLRIRDVPGSNSGTEAADPGASWFSQRLPINFCLFLKQGLDRFLPYHFQFAIQ
jgi:hypothetical protein